MQMIPHMIQIYNAICLFRVAVQEREGIFLNVANFGYADKNGERTICRVSCLQTQNIFSSFFCLNIFHLSITRADELSSIEWLYFASSENNPLGIVPYEPLWFALLRITGL